MSEIRLPWWAWPATVVVAVGGVLAVQRVAVAVLAAPPQFLSGYQEPAVITAVLVSAAVVVFAMVARQATSPGRTFFRISVLALLLSLVPDVAVGMGWLFVREGWTLAIVFMLQHVVAWAAVVVLLPRFAARS